MFVMSSKTDQDSGRILDHGLVGSHEISRHRVGPYAFLKKKKKFRVGIFGKKNRDGRVT